MPQIVVQGTLISYKDIGKGPALLCLHGWMHDGSSFDQLAEQLGGSFRIIAPDLPNFGKSEMTESTITIDEYGEFVASFIEKLKLNRYILVGHSMGGQIAIRATARNYVQPDKLILLAAAGIRDNNKTSKLLMKSASKIFKHVTPKQVKNEFYKKIGSDYSADLSPIHKKIIQYTLGTDVSTDAEQLKLPVLLIYGSEDKQTPEWMGQKFASAISGSKIEVIENGDHWLHQKAAAKAADIIKGFMNA